MFFSPRDRQDLLWQNWHGELLPHVGRVAFQLERRRVTWVPAETEKPGQVRVLAARSDGSSGRRKGRDEVGAEGVLGTEAGAAPCPVVAQTQGESRPHEGWAHPLSPRCLLSALPPSPVSRWLLWVPSPVLLLPAARYNRLEGWDVAWNRVHPAPTAQGGFQLSKAANTALD